MEDKSKLLRPEDCINPGKVLGHLRNILFEAINSGMMQKLDEHGLTFIQRNTLFFVDSKKICTIGDVSRLLCIKTSAATRVIRSLEKKKYIKRYEKAKDRRIKYLSLTSAGKSISQKLFKRPVLKLDKYLNKLSESEKEKVCTGINTVYKMFVKIGSK